MARSSSWDDALIKKLIELYSEDKYSTKQIGEMLGFSKNAIVGKIHRLELNKHKAAFEIPKEELEDIDLDIDLDNTPIEEIKEELPVSSEVAPKKQNKTYKLQDISLSMCVWPYGEENFTFCGKKVIMGKPYCREHFEKAYLRFNKKAKKA